MGVEGAENFSNTMKLLEGAQTWSHGRVKHGLQRAENGERRDDVLDAAVGILAYIACWDLAAS